MNIARPDLFESFLADYDAMQREEEEAKEDPVPPEEASGTVEPSEEKEAASTKEETEKPEPPEENDLTLSVAEATEEAVNKMENGEDANKEVNHRILQDFGHKIGGARKDAYAAYQRSLEVALNDEIPKKNNLTAYWPTLNYQKLLDSGVETWKISALRALRDSCPNVPRRHTEYSWQDEVTTKIKLAVQILKNELSKDEFVHELWENANTYITNEERKYNLNHFDATDNDSGHYQHAISQFMLYELLGHEQSLKDYYLACNIKIGWQRYDKYTLIHRVNRKNAYEDGVKYRENYPFQKEATNPTYFYSRSGYFFPVVSGKDSLEELKEPLLDALALDDTTKSRKKATKKEVPFYVAFYGDDWKARIDVKTPSGGTITMKDGFEGSYEANQYLDMHREELEAQYKALRYIPKFRHDKNEERTGEKRLEKDITPEDYMKTFGFYGVEFGNWVEGKARQQNLNESYTALLDLADALNVPPKALSLGGTLSLRFGSNGRGGRNAAMAHYEPDLKAINLTKKSGAGCLAHEWFHALDNYLGNKDKETFLSDCPSVSALTEALFIEQRNFSVESYKQDYEGLKNEYPVRFDVRLGMAKAREKMTRSKVIERSGHLDKMRSKPYWATTVELMARTFEAYVKYELAQKGIQNDYLVNIREEGEWAKDPKNVAKYPYPYPLMSEMPEIEKGFQTLFGSLKTKELDNGKVELFSCSNYETVNRQIEESHLMTKAELTKEEKAFIKFAEKELNLDVRFFEGPSSLHGQCQNDTIYLNRNTDKPLRWTFYHEAFHSLSKRDPKLYRDLLHHVEETKAITPKQIEAFRESHRAYDLPASTIKEELLANAFADSKQEAHQIHEMAETKPKLAVRLLTFTRRLARKVKSFFHEQEDALSMKQANALNERLDSLANDMQVRGEQVLADKNFVLGLDNLPILPDEHQKLYSLRPYVGKPEKQQMHDIQMAKNLLKKYSVAVVQDVLQTLSPRRMEKGYTASVMKKARSMALAH